MRACAGPKGRVNIRQLSRVGVYLLLELLQGGGLAAQDTELEPEQVVELGYTPSHHN